MKYAEILFQQKVGNNPTLTYKIPDKTKLIPGQQVTVTLRNRTAHGIVWQTHNNTPGFKTLPIKEIISEKPLIPRNTIQLAKWMSKYYMAPENVVIKSFIPKRIFSGNPVKVRKTENEQIIRTKKKELTEAQRKIVNSITKASMNNFLIHGITGSGKTEVYSRIAEKFIKKDKQCLILVPEISLTPQIIQYFQETLGTRAAVIHSKLSEGERHKSWQDIASNKAKLIIGSRSAIFSPFQDLGLIIIDEEHENSYKQDSSPRYSVHRVIEEMQNIDKSILAVYGSATPSVETAEKLKKNTLYLNCRISGAALPEIEIIDLRDEFKKKNFSIFSDQLRNKLEKILERKEQAILFINRRGAASSVVCRDCGHTEKCQKCDIPLTYHAKTFETPRLICHHCGIISQIPSICPQCKGANIRFLGIGTQRIEADLEKEFPKARVLRADRDTTSTKHGFEEIYKKFRNHEADILVGTQMIAKGLDLPKVNLVGVVLADIGLNIPDYRSTENNFQLLTQVSGRAGRASQNGKVIIQTYTPDNIALKYVQEHNYENFFKYEITQRKLLNNPPFSSLAKITYQHQSATTAQNLTENIENELWKIARKLGLAKQIEINIYPAYIARLRGKYQYIILLKSPKSDTLHKILEKLPKEYIMDSNLKIDIDPINTT